MKITTTEILYSRISLSRVQPMMYVVRSVSPIVVIFTFVM